MKILHKLADYFSPAIASRIVTGALYYNSVLEMYHQHLLVTAALDLAPAHVNCARIIFAYTPEVIEKLETICLEEKCMLELDSIVYYGLEGTPIVG